MEPLHDLLARASTRPVREPGWDPAAAPSAPWPLLEQWLRAAVDDGLSGAATAVLATASSQGAPTARVVLLQDVDTTGFRFATSSESPAGLQLAENPRAALVLGLREHGRQIRVEGAVSRLDAGASAAAFLARGPRARAVVIAGQQSAPLAADADRLVTAALPAQESDDPPVDPRWAAYLVAPAAIEFWQSTHGEGERRLRYRTRPGGWTGERLWP